jgi:hypothetical protein
VDYLERSVEREDVSVAYIYCSYKEQNEQTAVNLITSLLQQILRQSNVIPDEVVSLYNNHYKKPTRPALADWSKLLQLEVRRMSKVFIIIDALDECSENNGTRKGFLTEIQKLEHTVHLLVTSRDIPSIEHEFQNASRLRIQPTNTDIRKYLECRIASEPQLERHCKKDLNLRALIIDSLVSEAKGMYVSVYTPTHDLLDLLTYHQGFCWLSCILIR